MPSFTITVGPTAAARLKAVVDRHNADNGAALTVTEWLTLHVKEIVIQDDLATAAGQFRRQAEAGANAALLAERDRLLGTV